MISLNNFPDTIVRLDYSGRILYINKRVEKLTAHPPSYYLNKNFRELDFPPELVKVWDNYLVEVINTGEAQSFEFRVDTLMGNILAECRLIPENNNGQKNLLAIIRDITSEIRSSKSVSSRYHEQLSNLLEILPVGVSIIDTNRSMLEMNDSLERILCITKEDMLKGKHLDRKYLKHDGSPMSFDELPSNLAFKEKKAVHNVEVGVVKEDGEIVWTSVSAVPLSNNKCILVIADISEIKNYERKLENLVKERTEQLENQQAQLHKFHTAIEQSSASIMITDNKGNIEYVNPKFTQMTGYALNEAVGKNPRILQSGKTSYATYRNLWESITNGREWHGSILNKDKKGKLFWESVNISPVMDTNGSITHFIGVKEDISTQKKYENQLEKLNRTLSALKHSGQATIRAVNEQAYMKEVCKIIVDDCGYDFAWIGIKNEDEYKSIIPAASAGNKQKILGKMRLTWEESEQGTGPVSVAIRTGKSTYCNTILKNPGFKLWREEFLSKDFASYLVLPLIENGKPFGALSIYSKESDSFSFDEFNLLNELAGDLAYGINTIRIRTELDMHRTNLELLVKQRSSELETANEILNEAQEVAHIGHWRLDLESMSLQWSDEVYRIFGDKPRTLKTDLNYFLQFVHPDDMERVMQAYTDSVENKTFYDITHRIIKTNGEVKTVHQQCITHYSETGKPLYSLGVVQDITELEEHRNHLEELVKNRTNELRMMNIKLEEEIDKTKQVEILLKKSLDKEKELNELKSRFISTTSHEFRTPLTSILSSMQLIQRYRNKWSNEKIEDQFLRVKNSVMYLTNLLEDILTISHADRGKMIFKPSVIDLKKLCKEIIEDIKHKANEKHKFTFTYTSAEREFLLDPKLIRIIIVNLLSNAFKYSPNGGKVNLKVSPASGCVEITVSDQGMGMLPEDKEHLFEPFYRSVNTREIEGTGLGLSIVKRVAELHNGDVKFYTGPKGTRFVVKLFLNNNE